MKGLIPESVDVASIKVLLLIIIFIVFFYSCTKMETTTFTPVEVAQDCTSDNDHSDAVYCSFAKMGLGCSAETGAVYANSLQKFNKPYPAPFIGWGDSYEPGTAPFPCWEWVSTFSRGYLKFDVGILTDPEQIVSASLNWTTKRERGGTQGKACLKNLYEATGPWERGKTPGVILVNNLDTTAVQGGYYGVVDQVKKWSKHPDQNFGFMIEPSRTKTVAKSNSDCIDSLRDVKLVVKWKWKLLEWPGS